MPLKVTVRTASPHPTTSNLVWRMAAIAHHSSTGHIWDPEAFHLTPLLKCLWVFTLLIILFSFLEDCILFIVICGCATWHTGSSPTRDSTYAPCIGSSESEPLDCQGSPMLLIIVRPWLLQLMDEVLICLPVCFQLAILPSPLSFLYDWNQRFSRWYSMADFSGRHYQLWGRQKSSTWANPFAKDYMLRPVSPLGRRYVLKSLRSSGA